MWQTDESETGLEEFVIMSLKHLCNIDSLSGRKQYSVENVIINFVNLISTEYCHELCHELLMDGQGSSTKSMFEKTDRHHKNMDTVQPFSEFIDIMCVYDISYSGQS